MAIRRIKTDTYDARGYTDENALASLGVTEPDWLTRKMTHVYGKEGLNKFTFLGLANRNSYKTVKAALGTSSVTVNDIQYKWPIVEEPVFSTQVSYINPALTKPCIGHSTISVHFKDRMPIRDFGLMSPSRRYFVQVVTNGTPSAHGYEYLITLRHGNASTYIPISEFITGKTWTLVSPKVPESGSVGNESRIKGPGIMTNQISFGRFTQIIEGNVANKVVIYQFDGADTIDGKPTQRWVPEEMRQHELLMRSVLNTSLYTDKYNRVNGEINLKYHRNNKAIPIGAGVEEVAETYGIDWTYGLTLPYKLIDQAVLTAVRGRANEDMGKELIFHCGTGMARSLMAAFSELLGTKPFLSTLDGVVRGQADNLELGGYITSWVTPEGNKVGFVVDKMFNEGGVLGDHDVANGYVHPDTGLPLSSYTGVALNYADDNVQLVSMKGQQWLQGVYVGMSPLPPEWGASGVENKGSVKQLSTDVDESTYEVKYSLSINIKNGKETVLLRSEL